MYIWGFITKAVIFKPKKLKDGWEHKNGFHVSYESTTALSVVENAKAERKRSVTQKENFYTHIKYIDLRNRAESTLYKIQSSHNNYIEVICCFGGLFLMVILLDLLPVLWDYPDRTSVRLFLISLAVLIILIFLHWKKKKIDKFDVEEFLEIEDALYQHEYGTSQYKK